MPFVWSLELATWPEVVPRRALTKRRFTLPSWWLALAPGQPASFWVRVERTRAESGVNRQDYSGIAYIVSTTPLRGRRNRSNQGVIHERRQ